MWVRPPAIIPAAFFFAKNYQKMAEAIIIDLLSFYRG